MFPQVAPKFFASRADGPKNVGKVPSEPVAAASKASDGQAKAADGKGPITSPVTYEVHVGKNKHKVTVSPA
jgi:methylmalonyl-CoA carboxyltransferase 5S subunit